MDDYEKKFEWDDAKRQLNVEKHGIEFVDATEVFADPRQFLIDRHSRLAKSDLFRLETFEED